MHKTSVWVLACLLSAGAGSYLSGQVGRATITGVVRDTSNAVVPGATVKVTSTATRVEFAGETNESGIYTIGALPIGEYSVSFTVAGFKEYSRSGITLTAGQVARIDPVLEVGQASEKVTITAAAEMLDTETSQASKSVSSNVFAGLPLSFGGQGRNMAAFAAALVPGVRGSGYTMSIQGSPGASQGILIDGMTNLAGFLPGDFGEASVSPEAVQELTVLTGAVSAENGRQSGGTLSFTLKSGTNQPHGTAFYYLRNEVLNANNWNNNLYLAADPDFKTAATANFKRPLDRRKDYGFTLGGPVYIPKIYDGRNRSFVQFTMERFNTATQGPGSLTRSVPQADMWGGNLSRLLTNTQVGTDAQGRAVFEGQIFDPKTLSPAGTRFVADPFPGNIIPASRISTVAKNFAKVFDEWYQPVNSNLTNNSFTSNQNRQDVRQYTLKADHNLTTNHKLSGYFYKHGFPRNFQENASEVWSLKDPDLGGPLSRSIRQQRRGYNWSGSHDWIVKPAILNHLTVGLNNNANAFRSRQVNKSFADAWGIKGVGLGAPDDQVTRPVISLGGSPVVTFQSFNHDANRDEFYRSIVISDSLSWQKGSHTIKFGTEWNFLKYDSQQFNNTGGTFNFSARTTAIPGETFTSRLGNSFASLLLGEVDSASMGPTFNPITSRYYGAVFAQDNWKVTQKLTVNFGLRWSGNSPQTEKDDRIANFNPFLPDPNFGGILGAVEYMGTGAGRAGRRAPFSGNWMDWGPTAGLAYRMTERMVLRASYGISYTPEAFGWTYPWLAGFNQTNTLASDSKGLYLPVFNIDNGYPGVTAPPNMDPSYAAKFGGTRYSPGYVGSGYVQSFNFGIQTELMKDLLIETEYRGSKGTRLHSGGNVTPNQINPRELARGAVLTQNITSAAQASAAGLPYPYAGFSGQGAFTLLPFPQLANRGLGAFGDPVGMSTYHAANLIVTKRMNHGYYLYTAYTFSKAISNVGDVANGGSGGGIQDTYDRTLYKTIDGNDRTHFIKSAIVFELPVGRGRALLRGAHPIVNAIVGGWSASAILNYSSGTPLGHPGSRTRPNFWNGPAPYANFTNPAGFANVFNPDTFNPWNANDPGNRYFNPAAFTDAAAQSLGNSPNRFPTVRGLWNFNEDATFTKQFAIREQVKLQFRLEAFNLFNRHYFGGPSLSLNDSFFGNVRTASGNRSAQFGTRLEF